MVIKISLSILKDENLQGRKKLIFTIISVVKVCDRFPSFAAYKIIMLQSRNSGNERNA